MFKASENFIITKLNNFKVSLLIHFNHKLLVLHLIMMIDLIKKIMTGFSDSTFNASRTLTVFITNFGFIFGVSP